MNVFLKNILHSLKKFIKSNLARLGDCTQEHWENMKRIVALEAKQGEATKYCAMQGTSNSTSF